MSRFSSLVDAKGNPVRLEAGDAFSVRKSDNTVWFAINLSKTVEHGGNMMYASGMNMSADGDATLFNRAGLRVLTALGTSALVADTLACAGINARLVSEEGHFLKYEITLPAGGPFKGLTDAKGNPVKLAAGDTISIRKENNLITFGLDAKERAVSSNMAYAKGLAMTHDQDNRLFNMAEVHRLDYKRWCMLIMDILAIAGIVVKPVADDKYFTKYEIVSTNYAHHANGLKPPPFSKKPLSSKAPGDFDLFGFINREM